MRYKRYGRFCAVLHLMDKIEHFIITIFKFRKLIKYNVTT